MADDAITDLLAALSQVLIIISIGFASAKIKIIPTGSAPGIGLIVGTFALPALFLLNAASMDIASFDVRVLFGVLLARYIMIGIATAVSRLLEPNAANAKGVMGLYALFCTQSNDVAIGLPIVTAIYPVATYPANYPGYLIILSTVQVCAVNPFCIMLLEWGKSESSPAVQGEPRRSIGLTVLRGVATSPLVLGSLAGVVINLSCGRECLTSGVAGDTLQVVGNAFTFCALFLTGMSMDAKSAPEGDAAADSAPKGLIITALVLGKSLIHPIIIRLVLSIMISDPSGNLKDVRDFAYLYGTLPVASLPVVLANQHRLKPAMIAIASVVSTFVSMPLLLVSAAVFLNTDSSSVYSVTRNLSKFSCIVSILLLAALVVVYRRTRGTWDVVPMTVILNLAISQFLFHIALLGCEFATSDEGGTHIVYWLTFYTRCAMNTWLSNLAFYFLMLALRRYRTARPIPMIVLYAFGWVFPALMTAVGYWSAQNGASTWLWRYNALCWYQTDDQIYPDLVLTLLYFLTFLAVFILERRVKQQPDFELLQPIDVKHDSDDSEESPVYSEEQLNSVILISYSSRVKAILAVGFVRLCFVATLQFQMLSHVDPDGSFNVQMLFAVLLVDGGGAFTALAFLINNPLVKSTLKAMRLFCSKQTELQEVPWLGQLDSDLPRAPPATWHGQGTERYSGPAMADYRNASGDYSQNPLDGETESTSAPAPNLMPSNFTPAPNTQ